jgi:hypothetical protein
MVNGIFETITGKKDLLFSVALLIHYARGGSRIL